MDQAESNKREGRPLVSATLPYKQKKLQMKWLILSERKNGTVKKSKTVLETRGNVAEINRAQGSRNFQTEGMKYCGVHGKFNCSSPKSTGCRNVNLIFCFRIRERRYMPGKTAWGGLV